MLKCSLKLFLYSRYNLYKIKLISLCLAVKFLQSAALHIPSLPFSVHLTASLFELSSECCSSALCYSFYWPSFATCVLHFGGSGPCKLFFLATAPTFSLLLLTTNINESSFLLRAPEIANGSQASTVGAFQSTLWLDVSTLHRWDGTVQWQQLLR
jgi:hypothetical protein